jgi:hypothetical protein
MIDLTLLSGALIHIVLGLVLICLFNKHLTLAINNNITREKIHGRQRKFWFTVIILAFVIILWPLWFGTMLFYKSKVAYVQYKIHRKKR